MVNICGIDEAGRGPVIGPLVIAGTLIEEAKLEKLKKIDVKDSKLLSIKKIHELAPKIKRICKYEIIAIEPREIDDVLNSDSSNLNWLEAEKAIEIIKKLKPDKVIVDSPSPNLRAYKDYLDSFLKDKKIDVIVIHKAEKFEIVAAASILAKDRREKEMDKIKKKYGETGPGYMSNKITQKFLKENYKKHPEIFRRSWIPYKKLVEEDNNMKLGEF